MLSSIASLKSLASAKDSPSKTLVDPTLLHMMHGLIVSSLFWFIYLGFGLQLIFKILHSKGVWVELGLGNDLETDY